MYFLKFTLFFWSKIAFPGFFEKFRVFKKYFCQKSVFFGVQISQAPKINSKLHLFYCKLHVFSCFYTFLQLFTNFERPSALRFQKIRIFCKKVCFLRFLTIFDDFWENYKKRLKLWCQISSKRRSGRAKKVQKPCFLGPSVISLRFLKNMRKFSNVKKIKYGLFYSVFFDFCTLFLCFLEKFCIKKCVKKVKKSRFLYFFYTF